MSYIAISRSLLLLFRWIHGFLNNLNSTILVQSKNLMSDKRINTENHKYWPCLSSDFENVDFHTTCKWPFTDLKNGGYKPEVDLFTCLPRWTCFRSFASVPDFHRIPLCYELEGCGLQQLSSPRRPSGDAPGVAPSGFIVFFIKTWCITWYVTWLRNVTWCIRLLYHMVMWRVT